MQVGGWFTIARRDDTVSLTVVPQEETHLEVTPLRVGNEGNVKSKVTVTEADGVEIAAVVASERLDPLLNIRGDL
jgi:hypothetical protein